MLMTIAENTHTNCVKRTVEEAIGISSLRPQAPQAPYWTYDAYCARVFPAPSCLIDRGSLPSGASKFPVSRSGKGPAGHFSQWDALNFQNLPSDSPHPDL